MNTPTAETLESVMQPHRANPFATPQQIEDGFRWLADTLLDAIGRTGNTMEGAPTAPCLLLDREGMAAALGVSLTTFDGMRKTPGFPSLNLGGGETRGVIRFDPVAVKAYIIEQARVKREMEK